MLTVNDAEALCDLLATRGLGRVWVTDPPEGRIFMRVCHEIRFAGFKRNGKMYMVRRWKNIVFFSCNHRFAEVLAPSSVLLGPVVIGWFLSKLACLKSPYIKVALPFHFVPEFTDNFIL